MPVMTVIAVIAYCAAFLIFAWIAVFKLKLEPRGFRWFKYRTRKR